MQTLVEPKTLNRQAEDGLSCVLGRVHRKTSSGEEKHHGGVLWSPIQVTSLGTILPAIAGGFWSTQNS